MESFGIGLLEILPSNSSHQQPTAFEIVQRILWKISQEFLLQTLH